MQYLDSLDPFWTGVRGAVVAGLLGTSIGGVPLVVVRQKPQKLGNGLQNVPEGLAVARRFAVSGLRPQPGVPGGGCDRTDRGGRRCGGGGPGAVSLSHALLSWALAFAAGAMLFVISHEIVPETHAPKGGGTIRATTALFVGVATMLFLDHTLG